jgi:hypothetical protein
MKKLAAFSLVVVAVLVASATPSAARHGGWHHRPHVHAGPGWWGPPYRYYHPRPYYIYSPPPTVIVEQPPTYVQQPAAPPAPPPPPPPAPPAPRAPSAQQTYWYYCESARAYYPNVPTCPEPWIKVPPRE